jgi:hypothetical protein
VGLGSKLSVFGDEAFYRIAAESVTSDAGKDRIFGPTPAFAQPGIQHPRRFRKERGTTLFSAFSKAAYMGSGPDHNILAVQPGQLRNPQTGLGCDQKQSSIPAPDPSRRIRNSKQGLDLFLVEKLDWSPFMTFVGYSQNPLAMQSMRRLL